MPKRRVLLVDDEVTVLLTMKAVLEISGFDVETAASAREAKMKLRAHEYEMIITDMRMESDAAGREVIHAARTASYHPAVALLTAYPLSDEDWQDMGADKMLVKPMQTALLLKQIEKLLETHAAKLARISAAAAPKAPATKTTVKTSVKSAKAPAKAAAKKAAKKTASKKEAAASKKVVARKLPAKRTVVKKPTSKKRSR
ncbi:Response regulator receiver domain-containing protein [Bryocella elongata]|uniref:Response regulator receiver domain-containing protein n=1 Tax=Bryocella elongata TaxID=863522 RepID=A0A1H5YFP1_9BACT|nr:response regulator [Bryocella elongata]SEG22515.1 Response regulator receiver domain-containing protein [Bryocella elongata]